ncbi:MAG: hypothetical protein V2G42_09270 [bacterium JZ-2024 1]
MFYGRGEKDELPEIDFSLEVTLLEGSFSFFISCFSSGQKISPFSLLPQKVEISKNQNKKILPAKSGNFRNRHKKFPLFPCQQKVEIPKNRDKRSLLLPLTRKIVENRSKRNENEERGGRGKTLELTGKKKMGAILPNSQFLYMETGKGSELK